MVGEIAVLISILIIIFVLIGYYAEGRFEKSER